MWAIEVIIAELLNNESKQCIFELTLEKKYKKLKKLGRTEQLRIYENCCQENSCDRMTAKDLLQLDFFKTEIDQKLIRFFVSYLICIIYLFFFQN